ncbi:MAG: acyl--CoA ligase [Calditrichaeota bacterium]|nr:acyl--CoA ligase [Calditrichota bacterium]
MRTLDEKIAHARSLGEGARSLSPLPFKNVGELLAAQVSSRPEQDFLVFYTDENLRCKCTYREMGEQVWKTVRLLQSFGISRGDRIATVSFNHSDTVMQYFAAWVLGAVVVPINVGESDERIEYILDNSGVKLAFVRAPYLERLAHLQVKLPNFKTIIQTGGTAQESYPHYDELLGKHSGDATVLPDVSLEDEVLIVYTSGTTGNPKGVVLVQRNLLTDAQGISEWHGLTAGQTMMCVLPLHHVNGTVVTLMTPLYFGGTVILNQKFTTHHFFERLEREDVNVVSVVPTLLQFLLHEKSLEGKQPSLPKFRHIICGAGPLTVELASSFEDRFGLRIVHGYGLSETTCYSCFLPVELTDAEHRRWMRDYGFPSIGVPIPQNEMEIHDEHGNSLPPDQKGEIVIRGVNVMKYYFAAPEINEKTFEFGWFRSGDEGFFKTDDTGRKFFFITGRLKELIIRGGVNISPFEIDEVLARIPGVDKAMAVGFENDWYGEEVGAYVCLKSGAELSEEQILEFCKQELPVAKCPKVVVFGHEFPVTSTGKYQRNKCKHLFSHYKAIQYPKKSR